MSQDRPEVRRRAPSFRIDDILAPSTESKKEPASSPLSISSTSPLPSSSKSTTQSQCVPALRFGVDSLLSRHSTDQSAKRYESYYQILPGAYWSPPYTCYTGAHGCDACYTAGQSANSPFVNSSKFPVYTDLYSAYSVPPSTSTSQYPQSSSSPNKVRKPRRPWTRAVFSNLQRKGLEKRFQVQKYLTKADRHQLASMLGLSDNQVKVWFQNRRMKWRQDARESVTSTNPETEETSH